MELVVLRSRGHDPRGSVRHSAIEKEEEEEEELLAGKKKKSGDLRCEVPESSSNQKHSETVSIFAPASHQLRVAAIAMLPYRHRSVSDPVFGLAGCFGRRGELDRQVGRRRRSGTSSDP